MISISTCWQAYITHLIATVSAGANQRYWGRLQWFADKPAWLSPREVEAYIAMRQAAGAQAGTINRELALLRACLRHAERQHLIDRAPIIKGLPPPKPRMRALSRAEAAAMVKAAEKRGVWYERVYIRLALGTAQRPEAVIGLPWGHVDWEHRNIDFQPESNLAWRMKRRSIVPFNDMTEFALKLALKFRTCEHVMHYEDHRMDNPRRLVKRLARQAGIEDVSPHVLRHTAASLLLQDGADLLYVSRLLGHADTKITERVYFQHSPEWLKKVTDKLVF